MHVPVDPCLGRRRSVRANVRRIALRQLKGEEMHLLLDPGDDRPRFAEISLRVPWRMRQRHEHLPAMAATVLKPLLDQPGKLVELRTAHRRCASVARRHRKLKHLPHALA